MTEHARKKRLALAVGAGALTALLCGLIPLRDPSSWWHLTMGRLISTFGAIPVENHMMYTKPADAAGFYQPWLGGLALFEFHRLASIEGVLVARNMLMALAMSMVAWVASAQGTRHVILCTVATLAIGLGVVSATPSALAIPVVVLAMWLANATRQDARIALVSTLAFPLLSALVANISMDMILMPILAMTMVLERVWAWRKGNAEVREVGIWVWSLLASIVAWAANPRGFAIYEHIQNVLTTYPGHPNTPAWAPLWNLHPLSALALGLGILGVFVVWSRSKERDPLPLLWTLWLGALAMMLGRFAGVAALAIGLSLSLGPVWTKETQTSVWKPVLAALAMSLGALLTQPLLMTHAPLSLTISPYDVRTEMPHRGVLLQDTPLLATELMGAYSKSPRVYAPTKWSGFLLFRLQDPHARDTLVFADNRAEMVGEKLLKTQHLLETTDLWRGLFQGFNVGAALLDPRIQPALHKTLEDHPNWQVMHADEHHTLFMRVKMAKPE